MSITIADELEAADGAELASPLLDAAASVLALFDGWS
jgi:hypothetical protein